MSDLKSRVAYLQGLAAGLDLPEDDKQARLLHGIVEVLGEFAGNVEDLEEAQDNLEDYLESIDEDLYTLENRIYQDGGEDALADDYVEIECPECHSLVAVDSDLVDDGDLSDIQCPNCEAVIDLDTGADEVPSNDVV
ncbi:MAG: hypothetical protein QMC81_04600 [Thermoanaerobacterales bacterium]|nr:AraC family transcriptional regulator [Bacillota bacterium]MDI6906756.1 hypothetical protein [Thermoanaerobacterales bacterium]